MRDGTTGEAEEGGGPIPVFVLVGPQMGENIGATARAMWNFGLDRMRLVTPRDGWPNPRAEAMASGAGRVLDHVRVFEDTASACADLSLILATTARDRALDKPVLEPQAAMRLVRERRAAGERAGILFGPERSGLETPEIVRARAVVTVPVNPAFPSLNLAQCALLMAYEWQRSAVAPVPEHSGRAETLASAPAAGAAASAELDDFVARLVARLDAVGFFWPEAKAPRMRANLENLFRRMAPSQAELRTLHGVMRALAEPKRRRS